MPRTTDGPQWAQELVAEITGKFHPDLPTPSLTWNQSRKKAYRQLSSGRASSYEYAPLARIHVTAGERAIDVRMALLHEIAHWTLPTEALHGPEFAARAFDLYDEYGALDYALHWERRNQTAFHKLTRERLPSLFHEDGTFVDPCYACGVDHRPRTVEVTAKKQRKLILRGCARNASLKPATSEASKQMYLKYARLFQIQDEWLNWVAAFPATQYDENHHRDHDVFAIRREDELCAAAFGQDEWYEARHRALRITRALKEPARRSA